MKNEDISSWDQLDTVALQMTFALNVKNFNIFEWNEKL